MTEKKKKHRRSSSPEISRTEIIYLSWSLWELKSSKHGNWAKIAHEKKRGTSIDVKATLLSLNKGPELLFLDVHFSYTEMHRTTEKLIHKASSLIKVKLDLLHCQVFFMLCKDVFVEGWRGGGFQYSSKKDLESHFVTLLSFMRTFASGKYSMSGCVMSVTVWYTAGDRSLRCLTVIRTSSRTNAGLVCFLPAHAEVVCLNTWRHCFFHTEKTREAAY